MKICPSCRQTYPDDNLNFCLTDGSFLTTTTDNEPKTIYMDQPRITNQTNWGQPNFQQPNYQPPAVWQQNQQGIQNQPVNFPVRIKSQEQTLAIISLILGILGIMSFCAGIPFSVAAVITGVIAMNKEKSDPAKYGGRGLALGGLITGAVGLIISLGFIFLILIAGN